MFLDLELFTIVFDIYERASWQNELTNPINNFRE